MGIPLARSQSKRHLVISLASSTTTNYEWNLARRLPCELRAQLTPATFNLEVCRSPKRQSVRTDWRFFTGLVRLSASVTTPRGERMAVTRVHSQRHIKKWGHGSLVFLAHPLNIGDHVHEITRSRDRPTSHGEIWLSLSRQFKRTLSNDPTDLHQQKEAPCPVLGSHRCQYGRPRRRDHWECSL